MTMTTTAQMKQIPLSLENPTTDNKTVDRKVMQSGIRFYTNYCTKIPAPIVSAHFDVYKLLYWSAKHTLHRIIEGYIESEGVQYKVIYRGITRGLILHLIETNKPHQQIALSFRKPSKEWELQPTVILTYDDTY